MAAEEPTRGVILIYFNALPQHAVLQAVYDLLTSSSVFQPVNMTDLQQEPSLRDKVTAVVTISSRSQGIQDVLKTLPRVRIIACSSAGLGYIPLDYCYTRGIRVGNGSARVAPIVAEFAMALLLSIARRVKDYERQSREDAGSGRPKRYIGSTHLVGKTLGIVGMGSIGVDIARRAVSFGLKVVYCNRHKRSAQIEDEVQASYHSLLQDLLTLSDFVVISCPLSDETRHMFDHKEFSLM